jgi:hypothetical protein
VNISLLKKGKNQIQTLLEDAQDNANTVQTTFQRDAIYLVIEGCILFSGVFGGY